jgi:drug/metabolite transporter (DMT)-like permease
MIFVGLTLIIFPQPLFSNPLLSGMVFGFGIIAGLAGVLKVNALHYIDSTIYFPLLKLLAPALTIAAGVILFSETFTSSEWIGMLLGLFVPLMLITKSENNRQNNLSLGLILVLITSLLSAAIATANNFAVDTGVDPLVVLFFAVLGVFCSSAGLFVYRQGLSDIPKSIATHFK